MGCMEGPIWLSSPVGDANYITVSVGLHADTNRDIAHVCTVPYTLVSRGTAREMREEGSFSPEERVFFDGIVRVATLAHNATRTTAAARRVNALIGNRGVTAEVDAERPWIVNVEGRPSVCGDAENIINDLVQDERRAMAQARTEDGRRDAVAPATGRQMRFLRRLQRRNPAAATARGITSADQDLSGWTRAQARGAISVWRMTIFPAR